MTARAAAVEVWGPIPVSQREWAELARRVAATGGHRASLRHPARDLPRSSQCRPRRSAEDGPVVPRVMARLESFGSAATHRTLLPFTRQCPSH